MACPSRRQLAAYLAGSLPQISAKAIDAHVETCGACRSLAETLQSQQVRRPPEGGPPPMSAFESGELGRLGEYQLLEKIGQGGMGVVYRAMHVEMERVVALKMLPALHTDDPQALARFQREVKAAALLDHPNLVRAYDAREIRGTRVLIMEYVPGLDLFDLVRRLGPLPLAEGCEIVRQAAEGLQYASDHGLVHRDIKPSNLMLSRDGVVKILDLGLARLPRDTGQEGQMTLPDQALGTPDFMAPEQASDSRQVDIRADIYALGCTLFYLLTGRPVFSGPAHRTAFDKMTAHVHQPPPSLHDVRSDATAPLAALVERMLAKKPEDRFALPREVAEQLSPLARASDLRALADRAAGAAATREPAHSASPPPASPVGANRRRLLGAFAVATLAAVGLAGAAWLLTRRGDQRPPPARLPPPLAANTRDQLDGWIVMSWTLAGTGKPDLWLLSPDGSRRLQITNEPRVFDVHPSFSPDGRRVAFVRGFRPDRATALWVCGADGSAPRRVAAPSTTTERFLSPVWLSPGRLCYTRDPDADGQPDMELWEIDLDQGRPRLMFRYQDLLGRGSAIATDVSPDGRLLAIAAQEGARWPTADIYLADLERREAEVLWRDTPDDRKDARPLWAPDATRLAWHHNFTRGMAAESFYYGVGLALRDDRGEWTCQLQSRRDELVTPLAWSPAGTGLLCARLNREQTRADLFLMDDQFRTLRELFSLEIQGWRPGERDFARLADWAIIPPDIHLAPGD